MLTVFSRKALKALSSADRDAILRALLDEHLDGMAPSAVGNIAVAALTALPFVGKIPGRTLALLALPIMFAALELIRFARRWRHDRTVPLDRLARGAVLRAGVISLCWALAIQYCFIHGTDMRRGLLGMLAAGLMAAAVPACATLPRAGAMFIALIGSSILIAQARIETTEGWLTFALTMTFMGVLFRSLASNFDTQLAHLLNQKRLARSADTVRLLLNDYEEQSSDWLWQVDGEGRVITPSRRFVESAGGALTAGMRFDALFEPRPETDLLRQALRDGVPFRDLVLQCRIGDEIRWWRLSGRPATDLDGRVTGMEGVATDVTEARASEARIAYMAQHDALTGLPNRFMLNDTIAGVLARCPADETVGLLYLDLDQFKVINDSLGHGVGDQVLQRVSRLIEHQLHGGDLVARLGGDEFAILLRAGPGRARAETIAASILAALATPIEVAPHQVFTGASIGMAFAPHDGEEPGELLRNADMALYYAKANGRNRAVAFEPAMREAMLERQSIEHDLRSALGNGEMALHYQPLVNAASGEIVAYEALLRWNHPVRGLVMPGQFIPLAEDNGFIVQLGEWVLRQALAEVAHWPAHLRVAVNLSPIQLRNPALLTSVVQALAASGVPAHRLELEVTESVLMHESEAAMAALHRLRAIGVRIALDDFGTGYSSLTYLRRFPFDKIKIDRSFVTDIASGDDSLAIVRAVVGLAASLGMETTAEGVEFADQLAQLRAEGVTEVQGYLFHPARAPEAIEGLRDRAPPARRSAPPAPLRRPDAGADTAAPAVNAPKDRRNRAGSRR